MLTREIAHVIGFFSRTFMCGNGSGHVARWLGPVCFLFKTRDGAGLSGLSLFLRTVPAMCLN